MSATFRWPWLVGVAVLAGGAGYGLSRSRPVGPAAPSADAVVPVPVPKTVPQSGPGSAVTVRLTPARQAAAGILVAPVRAEAVAAEIFASGVVDATPGAEAAVVTRAAGVLQQVSFHLGDEVRAGEVLGRVDSFEATDMAMNQQVADAKVALARQVFAREAKLFGQGVSPRQDMEAAQAQLAVAEAEARRAAAVATGARATGDGRTLALVSPIGGRIVAAHAVLGDHVAPDTEIFRVAHGGAVHVEAAVPAADSARLEPGATAVIEPAAGAPIAARVHGVTPAVDPHTQAATVVVEPRVAAEAAGLKLGEGVRVRLQPQDAGAAPRLAVPEDAAQTLDGRDVLFVDTPQGFVATPVRLGARGHGRVEILAGVAAGTRVATRNAFLLKAEMLKPVSNDP